MKMSRLPEGDQSGSGFTLVELLVSLAVLAILVALSMSGVGAMGERGDLSRCTHHLKQLHIAFTCFTADHNGVLPDKNPKRLFPYLNLSDNDMFQDTAYTCPAIQRGVNAAVGAYHRSNAINIYATTEKLTDPDKITRIQTPSQMILFTEGTILGDDLSPEGRKGKRYLSTTRLERTDDLLLPHSKRQNAIFGDGSARLIDKEEFYQGGRWNTLFWRGYL